MENEINFEGTNPIREFFEKLQNMEKARNSGCNEEKFEKLSNELHTFIEENHAELVLFAPLCFVRKERKSFKNTKEGIDEILKNNFDPNNLNSILYQVKSDIDLALKDEELMFRITRMSKIKTKLKEKYKEEYKKDLIDIQSEIDFIIQSMNNGLNDINTINKLLLEVYKTIDKKMKID
ncbi:hypothetical protein HON22_02945 [Candidatus Peregrinibacteria bacterium]|jgi:hypothetical protein|nr:hypothetical protein [Candidatus Peregrinibacteria bacterium]